MKIKCYHHEMRSSKKRRYRVRVDTHEEVIPFIFNAWVDKSSDSIENLKHITLARLNIENLVEIGPSL